MGHTFTKSILKRYDIRGVYEKDFSNDDAFFIGKSYGTFLKKQNRKLCVVGRDARTHSPILQQKFIEGLLTTGIDAIDIGMVMSPCMYWAMWHLNADCGMIITASHNPKEYNGFKMLTKDDPVWGDDIQELGKIAQSGSFAEGQGVLKQADVREDYIKYVLSFLQPSKKRLKIVFDTGNGTVGNVIKDVATGMNIDPIFLFTEPDGSFPNHLADPSLPDQYDLMVETIKKEKCDMGVMFDGDGDRIGIADSTGYIFFGDEMLDVMMRPFLKENPGEKVLLEVTSSQSVVMDIENFGGEVVFCPPGHSLFKAKMKSDNIKIAAETAGHAYYGDNHNFDDSLVALMKIVNYISNIDETLYDIRQTFPKTFSTKKYKIKTQTDSIKWEIPEKISKRMKETGYKVMDIDGARVYLNETDWFLIRGSNTEPAMTARAEALTNDGLEQCKKILQDELKKEGVDLVY
ncbi:MAG: phosphomannomutase/phosphoglucomutase [Rickettsiales bacterium]|jgi:phosphomannomutase|nr:phosphomannomutase/phosphoglucomutase [Rickettsiales bacterium]